MRELTTLPKDAGLWTNLGIALYQGGRLRDALEPLQRAAALDPSRPTAWLYLGAVYVDLQQPASAILPLERAVKAAPRHARARELLADAFLVLGQPGAALPHYLEAARADASRPHVWAGLGRSAEQQAMIVFEQLEALPGSRGAVELMGADILVSMGKPQDAQVSIDAAIAADPTWRTALDAKVELLEALDRKEDAARARAMSTPQPQDCSKEPGACAFREGRLEDILRLPADGNPHTLFWVVKALNAIAEDAFARLESLPPSLERHTAMGDLRMSQGRTSDAITAYRAALALAPDNPALRIDLAFALQSQRAHDEVVTVLAPLAARRALTARGWFVYGDALLDLQRLDAAVAALTEAVTLSPDQVVARAALGRALLLANRPAEALPHLEAARSLDRDGAVYYQLAQAYQRLGRADDARTALREYQKRSKAEQ